MSHKIKRAFLITLLLTAPLFASSAAVTVPDWVHDTAARQAGKYPPETKAVVLLDDETVTVTAPGEVDIVHRRVVRLLRPEGREEGKLYVHLGANDKMQSIHAWTLDSAGRQFEVKDKEFIEASPYHEALYDDIRFRAAEAPAAQQGSVIAFEYSVHRHLWMDQYHWIFQEENPVAEARFTLQMPPGWEYKAGWANQPAQEPASLGNNRWQWVQRDVAGIEQEKMRPDDLALAGHMELAFYEPAGNAYLGSWQSIGDWYYHLTDGRRNLTPEMTAKVQQLTGNAPTFEAKVHALTEFMQGEIRYVEISIRDGGYKPHPASDIFHYRYGDCKDKVTLLSSLLKEAGISSEYVLVDTQRGVVKPAVPSTLFNHAILALELPKDEKPDEYKSVVTLKGGQRYLIFDPTDEYTPVGRIRSGLQGNYALLVRKEGGELIQLPVLAPDTNRLDRDGKFVLATDGSLSGTVIESLSGDHANGERHWLASANEDARAKSLDRFLNMSLKNVSVQGLKIGNLDSRDKDLTMEYQITTQNYAQHTGPLLLLRPRVLGDKTFVVDWAKRKYPIELRTTWEKDTYEIELPPEYAIDDLPEPQHIDVGFASYKSSVEAVGSKLRYSREYVVRDTDIGPDKFADLRKLEQVIGSDEYASAVLKKKP